jgi:F420-non-reducing hydrogenase iron-sulfur subunit
LAASGGSPRILAIVCSWHPLTAADNAGMDGLSYGTSTTIVPVDCAGTVSAASILRAFAGRADGVLVAACGRGDCHYVNGNESCEAVVAEARELMRVAGMEPERLRLDLSSEVDGARFVGLVEEFAAEVAGRNDLASRRRVGKRSAKTKATTKTGTRAAKPAPKKAKPAKKTSKKTAGKMRKKATNKVEAKDRARKAAPKKAKPAKKAGRPAKKSQKKAAVGAEKKRVGKTVGRTAARGGRKR